MNNVCGTHDPAAQASKFQPSAEQASSTHNPPAQPRPEVQGDSTFDVFNLDNVAEEGNTDNVNGVGDVVRNDAHGSNTDEDYNDVDVADCAQIVQRTNRSKKSTPIDQGRLNCHLRKPEGLTGKQDLHQQAELV